MNTRLSFLERDINDLSKFEVIDGGYNYSQWNQISFGTY